MDSNCLGHYLKIWTDRYRCSGEVKGSTVNLEHEILIVTSNHSIDDLFAEQPKMIEPLHRRFVSIEFMNSYLGIDRNFDDVCHMMKN